MRCRSLCPLIVAIPFVLCFAQEPPAPSQGNPVTVDRVPLEILSSVPVPALPAQSIALPAVCSTDGTIFIRTASMDGVDDPVSISSDGKVIARFGRERINDIANPLPVSMFLADKDVYILTLGRVPLGLSAKWRTPTGKEEVHEVSSKRPFIARFHRDGTYVGSTPLDVPFQPTRFGVFDDGSFLVAGLNPKTDEPRLALASFNGQFQRLVELNGDIHARSGTDTTNSDANALPQHTAGIDFEQSLLYAVHASQIVKDGPNLLVLRPTKGPVFSVAPGGNVRQLKLQVQGVDRLYTIKTTPDTWIAEFTHHVSDRTGDEFFTYAFDPSTGTPLKEYIFPADLGFGMACISGDEFTFVMADPDTKNIKLVRLGQAMRSGTSRKSD